MSRLRRGLNSLRAEGCAEEGGWPHDWDLADCPDDCGDDHCTVTCKRCGTAEQSCKEN